MNGSKLIMKQYLIMAVFNDCKETSSAFI